MATKTDFSTPDIPQSTATFYVSACTRINAPASLVFRTLRNTETWKDWNRWIPRVAITFQPDDEDDATLAEIEELVRNTSIAVNFDSDITDGAVMPGPPVEHSTAFRRGSGGGLSVGNGGARRSHSIERPSSPPPVTRQRLASNASRFSGISQNSVDGPSRNNSTTNANGTGALSAAQKYQAATEARRASLSSGQSPPPPTDQTTNANSVLLESPGNASLLMPAPANTQSTALAAKASRRKSATSTQHRRQLHINALYGEPSVRIQLGTKMNLYMRIKLPHSQEMREQGVVVTEVSRPDDPQDEPGSRAAALMRTQTHTTSISGVYRLVWTSINSYNPPKSYPRFLFHTQRVHEIRPYTSGDGKEMCEYWDWECQKGMLSKRNKKESAYMEERMAEWGRRLGEFCESMGGAVERRDFVG
ncbi:uncharacterized protein Z520_00992 [Fonsecaea multimorphosa CBS 102226]|uniref:Uncharacterized protein n=1 Tax=Fonsecaea multimorphosa CBS 102226 TaxID=1442371 RepID=A0A0D2IZM9_9EURO|nr:uncharacterized protein Z520_00992 [Fonsecaea multimorphosa CBS 102226]KIY02527.1 hypothetical protein Z520_00992 [Fonsecaea multimorphosa CBS 102226]OAL31394.1 hypothetical protein AYO22_00986 [Fonsecaea multimorphosa]